MRGDTLERRVLIHSNSLCAPCHQQLVFFCCSKERDLSHSFLVTKFDMKCHFSCLFFFFSVSGWEQIQNILDMFSIWKHAVIFQCHFENERLCLCTKPLAQLERKLHSTGISRVCNKILVLKPLNGVSLCLQSHLAPRMSWPAPIFELGVFAVQGNLQLFGVYKLKLWIETS